MKQSYICNREAGIKLVGQIVREPKKFTVSTSNGSGAVSHVRATYKTLNMSTGKEGSLHTLSKKSGTESVAQKQVISTGFVFSYIKGYHSITVSGVTSPEYTTTYDY